MKLRFRAVFLLAAAMPAGCGAGGGSTAPTPPTATTAPSPLSVSASSLAINAIGVNKQVTTSEANYGGAFSVALGTCASIVSASPATARGPQATFTFSATAAGSCTLSVTDASGQKQDISIVVTTTSGSLQ